MKKFFTSKTILFAAFLSFINTHAQTFTATYDFANITQTSGTVDPTPTPTAVGITFGSFSAVGQVNPNPNAGGRFSFQGWPTGATNGATSVSSMTGALSPTQYYQVTLTPQAGFVGYLDSIKFSMQRSATGIRSYAVRASVDGFTNNLPAAVFSSFSSSLSVVNVNEFFVVNDVAYTSAAYSSALPLLGASSNTPVTFRFYGWNAEGSGGTFSIDNVTFKGSVVACNLPTITAATDNSPICANETLSLNVNTMGANLSYSWTGAGAFNANNIATPTINNPVGNYTVVVSNACGSASAVITPNINSVPALVANPITVCTGQPGTLTASGATSYSWNTGDNSSSIVVSPSLTTNYTVTGTSAMGCVSTITTQIFVTNNPSITVNSPMVCSGSSATLIASGATTYTWNTNAYGYSVVVTPTNNTVYSVSGNLVGCPGTYSAVSNVSVISSPIITITQSPSIICPGQSATLIASGASSYIWNTGATTSSIIITPSETSTYSVIGYDTNGCSSSTQTTVIVYIAVKTSNCMGITEYFELPTNIAPNPAKENVELAFTNNASKNITIINSLGETVLSKTSSETNVKIDVSSFPQGIYFVRIMFNNQRATKKLIIQ